MQKHSTNAVVVNDANAEMRVYGCELSASATPKGAGTAAGYAAYCDNGTLKIHGGRVVLATEDDLRRDAGTLTVTGTVYDPANTTGTLTYGDRVTSDGDTGGAGSAGAGNQYVEFSVDGTVYKLLHDGTVGGEPE